MSEAAGKPEVFRLLLDRYDGRVPAVDEPIRAYLIRELGFSKGGADQCLASFRDTMSLVEFVRSDQDGNPDTVAVESDPIPTLSAVPAEGATNQRAWPTPTTPDFVFHLGGGRIAVIEIRGGSVTSRHLKRLERFVRLQGELLDEDDLEQDEDPESPE